MAVKVKYEIDASFPTEKQSRRFREEVKKYVEEVRKRDAECSVKLTGYIRYEAANTHAEEEEPMIKTDGEITPMGDTGFVRENKDGKGRMDLLPWYAIIDVSKHCQKGAKIFGERNINKGAPLHSLLDSGSRHLALYIAGETDEDHLTAACWNLLFALNQRTTHPELDDMPKSEK